MRLIEAVGGGVRARLIRIDARVSPPVVWYRIYSRGENQTETLDFPVPLDEAYGSELHALDTTTPCHD